VSIAPWLFSLYDKPDMAVWVTDRERFVYVRQYGAFRVDFKTGDLLKPQGTPAKILGTQERVARLVPAEVYGVACKSIGIPIEGGVVGVSFSVANEELLQQDLARLHGVVSDINESGRAIASSAEAAREQMTQLRADLERTRAQLDTIEAVRGLIASISDDSRYISLNAMVESRRLGEQGKTFAVVASEMKSLSLKTRQSVATVKHDLEEIRGRFGALGEAVAKADQHVQDQSKATQTISGSLAEILDALRSIAELAKKL
jgi:hypothetical protein